MNDGFPYSIPEKRNLSEDEINFLSHLFKIERPEWVPILKNLKVIGRCGCGECPTIMFGKGFDSEIQNEGVVINYMANSEKDNLVGVVVFGSNEMPTELEFYSIDGLEDIVSIPSVNSLRPLGSL